MTSALAAAAKAIRADIKVARAAKTLPPHPEGIVIRVTSRRASLMTAIDIDVSGAPHSWAYSGGNGAVSRPSPANLTLREALRRIAGRHYQAGGPGDQGSFINVAIHLEES
jgi:hypothetical protein